MLASHKVFVSLKTSLGTNNPAGGKAVADGRMSVTQTTGTEEASPAVTVRPWQMDCIHSTQKIYRLFYQTKCRTLKRVSFRVWASFNSSFFCLSHLSRSPHKEGCSETEFKLPTFTGLGTSP
jgi:hypothetical protein